MLNYSHQRIKQILKDFDCTIVKVNHLAYKANRYQNEPTLYKLIQSDTKVLLDKVSLDALRVILTDLGYPLKQIKKTTGM